MRFVTDRTQEDVLLCRCKGNYSYEDLNRVEKNVQTLCALASEIGIDLQLSTKTDWAMPGDFDPQLWPTSAQMQRYLQNVRTLCSALELQPPLPSTMEALTVLGANQIENALKEAYEEIGRRMS